MADKDGDHELEYTIEPPDEIPSTMIEILYCRAYIPDWEKEMHDTASRHLEDMKEDKGEDDDDEDFYIRKP